MASSVMRISGFVLALLAGAPAQAVDVINRDKVPRDIVVNYSEGESTERTLQPQEKVANICGACVILSGDTSAEATGNQTILIQNGKAKVASGR